MTMRMAKADADDYEAACKLVNILDQADGGGQRFGLNATKQSAADLGAAVFKWLAKHNLGQLNRIVHGGWTAIEDACDPDLDYLEYKPHLKVADDAFKLAIATGKDGAN